MPAFRRSSRRALAGAAVVALLAAACGGGSSEAKPPENVPPAPARENVTFFYQPLKTASEVPKLGNASVVVLSLQNGAEAANLVHSTGAKAYRYVQTYWAPVGSKYDGIDIANEPDWTFCSQGSSPVVGRTDASGRQWQFLDMNEQAVHAHFAQKLARLKQEGWDGVFFDRGYASLTGFDTEQAGIWNTVSTCTQAPFVRGATFADAYVGMETEVAKAGLELMFNYGVSPFDPQTPLRPDSKSKACGDRDFAACPRLDDAWEHTNWVLDEGVAHPKDEHWDNDFALNRANEQDPAHGGQTVGLITQSTLAGDESKDAAYFQWARVKLFRIPLAVNTGDSGCAGITGVCNHAALYPELVDTVFGAPRTKDPASQSCVAGSTTQCVWNRTYDYGMSVVNVTPNRVAGQQLELGVNGCRYVQDVFANRPLADNQCVESVTLDLPAWSGRPLRYGTKPW